MVLGRFFALVFVVLAVGGTQALAFDRHDYGYAYEASERCKGVYRLFKPSRADELQARFNEGRETFRTAIKRRDLEWACGAAMRVYDGTRGLGPTILTRVKP